MNAPAPEIPLADAAGNPLPPPEPTPEQLAEEFAAPHVKKFTPAGLETLKALFLTEPKVAETIAWGTAEPKVPQHLIDAGRRFASKYRDRLSFAALESLAELYTRDAKAAAAYVAGLIPESGGKDGAGSRHIPPPRPLHNLPGDPDYERTPEDKSAEINRLLAEIKKEGRYTTGSDAWAEARRRNPSLFR